MKTKIERLQETKNYVAEEISRIEEIWLSEKGVKSKAYFLMTEALEEVWHKLKAQINEEECRS